MFLLVESSMTTGTVPGTPNYYHGTDRVNAETYETAPKKYNAT